MSQAETSITTRIERAISRLARGDASAREELIGHALARLSALARRQLRQFPAVARWEQTDDVVQGASRRLHRALADVRPQDARQFFHLCSALIRRELIDLKRKLFGPRGSAAHHASPLPGEPENHAPDSSCDPAKLARWTELHERIAALPDDLREVFELVWYQELTHHEAAAVLGVATKTIQRRWREARLQLHYLLDDDSV